MAKGPGGQIVGRVSVRVLPNTADFRRELKKQLEALEKAMAVEIPVEPDMSGFRERVEASAKEAARRASGEKVTFDADTSRIDAAARKIRDSLRPLSNSNMPDFLGQMSRLDRVMRSVAVNATRIREGLVRASRASVDLTRRAFNLRSHFQAVNQTVRNLPGHIGRIRFVTINNGAARTANTFRALGRAGGAVFGALATGARAAANAGTRALSGIAKATGNAFEGLFKGFKSLTTGLQTLGTSLFSVISTLVQVAGIATLIALAGTAITAAWAIAATAIAAIPALLFTVAAPIGAIVLGLDGIKAAARTLKPEFDRLKKAVSDTFEKGLLPAFETIKNSDFFETVQHEMQGIALSLSKGAQEVAEFVSAGRGLSLVEQSLNNVEQALFQMLPGIRDVIDGFLQVGAQTGAFDALVGAVNTFGEAFRNSVGSLIGGGQMQEAFRGLEGLLGELSQAFVELVENGIKTFAAAAPGINRFLDELTGFFDRFDYASLGKSLGGVFDGLATAIGNIDQSTIDGIEQAFAELAETFNDPAFQKDLGQALASLPDILRSINDFVGGFMTFVNGVGQLAQYLQNIPEHGLGLGNIVELMKQDGAITGRDPAELAERSWWSRFWDASLNLIGVKGSESIVAMARQTERVQEQTRTGFGLIPGMAGAALDPLPRQVGQVAQLVGPAFMSGLEFLNSNVIAAFDTMALSATFGIQKMATSVRAGMTQVSTSLFTGLTGLNSQVIAAFGVLALSAQLGLQKMVTAVTAGMTQVGVAMFTSLTALNSQVIAAFGVLALSATFGMQRMATAVTNGMLLVRTALVAGLTMSNSQIIAAVAVWALSVQLGMQRMVTAVTTSMILVRTAVMTGLVGINSTIIAGVGTWALSVTFGMQRVASAVTAGFAAVRAAVMAGMTSANSVIIAGTNVWALTMQLAGSRMASAVTSGFAQINAAVRAGMAAANSAIIAGGAVWASSVRLACGSAVRAARSYVGQFRDVGAEMGQGLADGLNSKAGAVEAAARRLADAAAAAVAAAAQVRSPSRVFIQLGNYIGLGLAVGMDRCRGAVIRSARVMVRDVTSAAEQLYNAFDGAAFGDKWASDMTAGLADGSGSVAQLADAARNRTVGGEWSTVVESRWGVSDEIVEALQGWQVQIDRNGIAKLVNKSNTRKERRR